ncbi:MAG: aminotransferase class IV [Candidatus Omnitrophica bacterium]|nr:aminotransferase class IV [Candidatus Omnitrophota bacterium]
MQETVFLNGRFLATEDARISALTPGFLYGLGLFESMRSCNGKIVYLDEHLGRIKGSAELIGIGFPFSLGKLKEIIKKTVQINGFKDTYVRLTLGKAQKGRDILLMAKKYQPYPRQKYKKGFRAIVSSLKQGNNSLLVRLKTTSRLLYQLSLEEAENKGFDEAIILNNRGCITEATRSNLFLVKNNELFTPSLSCGCLDGITRRVIFDLVKKSNLKIYEGNFTLKDLCAADEAFLTNSLIGIMPLVSVGKQRIGGGSRGKTTEYLSKKYNSLLKDEN